MKKEERRIFKVSPSNHFDDGKAQFDSASHQIYYQEQNFPERKEIPIFLQVIQDPNSFFIRVKMCGDVSAPLSCLSTS